MVAPWARPRSFSSRSGSVALAKARPAVTDTLKGVRGASVRLPGPLRLPPSMGVVATTSPAASFSVPTVLGSSRRMCATLLAWLAITPRSISVMSSLNTFCRREGLISSARGTGDRSSSALASATAAWPSTAAWCSWVYSATRRRPFGPGARPSKTWNFHSGRSRCSSCVCSRATSASSSGMPAPLGTVPATTCWRRSGSASTQAGLARFSGIVHSRRRSTGSAGNRAAMCWRTAVMNLPLKPAGSSYRCSAPTCMGISGVSRYRKVASRPESCFMPCPVGW